MKVVLGRSKCNNNGLCQKHAPELFQMGADGNIVLLDEEPDVTLRKKAQLAAFFCPRGAIAVED